MLDQPADAIVAQSLESGVWRLESKNQRHGADGGGSREGGSGQLANPVALRMPLRQQGGESGPVGGFQALKINRAD